MQSVAKYSTSDVLGRDWSEVASELSGGSKQQCKERYRFADTVAELTFVFIRVIFLGSPAFRSSLVLTKVTDSADSARPIHYSTFDASPPSPAPSLSPTSSLMQMHSRDVISEHAKCVWQQRWRFWAHSSPVVLLLAHACTQVDRFSQRNSADSAYLCETDTSKYVRQQRWRFWVSKYVWQQEWRNPVYVRRVDSSGLL